MDAIVSSHSGANAESAILEELRSAPVPATELRQRISKRLGLKAPQLKLLLDALIAARKIHGRPKLGKTGKPTKAIETYVAGAAPPPPPSPRELAPQEILSLLGAKDLGPTDLKSRVEARTGKIATKDFSAVLAELLAARRVFVVYKRDKHGKPLKAVDRYSVASPPPDAFITPLLTAWRSARVAALAAGVEDGAFVEAFLRGLAQEGVSVGAATSSASPGQDQAEVMRALRDLVQREGHGALIAMRKLRAALKLPKDRFDAAVLELYGNDALILHHHDYVGSLTDAERQDLVVDAHGNHYVGAALRGET